MPKGRDSKAGEHWDRFDARVPAIKVQRYSPRRVDFGGFVMWEISARLEWQPNCVVIRSRRPVPSRCDDA